VRSGSSARSNAGPHSPQCSGGPPSWCWLGLPLPQRLPDASQKLAMHTADGRPIGGGIVGPSIAYWLSGSYAPGRALNDAGQKSASRRFAIDLLQSRFSPINSRDRSVATIAFTGTDRGLLRSVLGPWSPVPKCEAPGAPISVEELTSMAPRPRRQSQNPPLQKSSAIPV